jgi:hypothetical protein
MINGIVRPPRAKYNNSQLGNSLKYAGNKVLSYKDKLFIREDVKLEHEGKSLEVTIYLASNKN